MIEGLIVAGGLLFLILIIFVIFAVLAVNYNKEHYFFIDEKKIEVKTSLYSGSQLIINGQMVDDQPRAYYSGRSATLTYSDGGFNLKVNIGTSFFGFKPVFNVFLNNTKLAVFKLKGEKVSSNDYGFNFNENNSESNQLLRAESSTNNNSKQVESEKKFCSNCGKKIAKNSKYCSYCGELQND